MKKNQKKILVISLAAVLFVYLLLSFFVVEVYLEPVTGYIEQKDIFFEVYNEGNLTMGGVPFGLAMIRDLIIENERDYPVNVYLKSFGNASKFIFYEKNPVYVGPNETVEIKIHWSPYPPAEEGKYEGNLMVLTTRWF